MGFFFHSCYTMSVIATCPFCGCEIIKRIGFAKPERADLVCIRTVIDQHEDAMAVKENGVDLRRRLAHMVRVDLKLGWSLRNPQVQSTSMLCYVSYIFCTDGLPKPDLLYAGH